MLHRNSRPAPWVLAAAVLLANACGARGGVGERDASVDANARDASVDASARDARGDADAMAVVDAGPEDTGPIEADAGPESDIGDPCGDPADCLSADEVVDVPACIGVDASWPNGGLWVEGYCTAQCTPSTDPGVEPLAQDDCPADALCVPVEDGVGVCLLACASDGECRMPGDLGYACRRTFAVDGFEVPLGACMAYHCQTRGCPSSARCDC